MSCSIIVMLARWGLRLSRNHLDNLLTLQLLQHYEIGQPGSTGKCLCNIPRHIFPGVKAVSCGGGDQVSKQSASQR
jgi:hypothetical protein